MGRIAAAHACWCKCGAFEKTKIRKLLIFNFLRIFLGDPLGARTQDPNIKSVVLYRLS